MTTYIQDGNLRLAFVPTIADTDAPTITEIEAGEDLTGDLMALATPDEGAEVPDTNPTSTWDGTLEGTRSGQITGMFAKHTEAAADVAWTTLPYGTTGYFVIRRAGDGAFAAADVVEVWPIRVRTRSMTEYGRNKKDAFDFAAAVPPPGPTYDVDVAAGA